MASEDFDFDFVDPLLERLICSICTNVMRDPHLVVCCGQKYCASCLQKWLDTQRIQMCPHCRATDKGEPRFEHVIEKGVKSEIESLHIRCSNYLKGCPWTGEIRNMNKHLDKHLQSQNGCDFVLVECPNRCQGGIKGCTKLLRKNLLHHLQNRCELRKVTCMFCSINTAAKDLSGHHSNCEMFPMDCPNRCGQHLVRKELENHHKICMFEWVWCEYNDVGCKERMQRKDMSQHMVSYQTKHLEMTRSTNKKLKEDLEMLKQEVSHKYSIARHELKKIAEKPYAAGYFCSEDSMVSLKTHFQIPCDAATNKLLFRMLQFSNIMSNKIEWISPDFSVSRMIMYLHVKQGIQPSSLGVNLHLKYVPYYEQYNYKVILQIEQPFSKVLQQKNVGSWNIDLIQPLKTDAEGAICYNFELVMGQWVDTFVEDDTILWTVSTQVLGFNRH